MSGPSSYGKGDKQRPIRDRKRYDNECDRLFGDYCRFPHAHGPECKLRHFFDVLNDIDKILGDINTEDKK